MIFIYIIVGIIVLVLLYLMFAYNHFITLVNRAKESWADIDVQLKRRYDLIPNLVNTVKGYATHESGTLEKVTQARNMAMGATNIADKAQAENMLSGTLKSLFAVSEQYPDLKANQNFLDLQSQLTDTEDKIQAARRFYNGNVRDLNTALEVFPGNMISGAFHFSKMEFFNLDGDETARQNVEVKF